MTKWEERIRSHRAFVAARELSAALTELGQVATPDELESKERLEAVCDHINDLLSDSDPRFVTPMALNRLQPAIEATREALDVYSVSRSSRDLVTLDEKVDALVNELPTGGQSSSATGDLLTYVRAEAESFLDDFKGFVADEQEAVKRLVERTRQEAEAARQQLSDANNEHKSSAQLSLKALEDHKTQAAQMVGILANTSMAGGFQDYAERQERTADLWRWISVAAAAAAALLAFWTLRQQTPESLPWSLVISKALAVAVLGGIAAYAGRESSAHRTREIEARQLELALRALDPYLASLPEDRRDALKEQIAPRIFGQPLAEADGDETPANRLLGMEITPEFLQRLQELLKALQEATKRSG